MKREILFRAKQLDTGEWIHGIAFPHDDGSCTMFSQHPMDGAVEGREVDPESVGEYTGMRDKSDRRIFDGDILEKISAYVDLQGREVGGALVERYVVEWDEMRWIQRQVYSSRGSIERRLMPIREALLCRFYEVIGNIYDNPELMQS